MQLVDIEDVRLPDDLPYKASVRRVLAQLPHVDAVPVVHGQWIESPRRNHWFAKDVCGNCGFHEKDYRDLSGYNYCPNCGAKMDVKEDVYGVRLC